MTIEPREGSTMNNARRKQIDAVIAKLEECQMDSSMIGEEEQDYADNMPENLQESERYEKAEDDATMLDSIAQEIDVLIEQLREVQ